jgi:hypothetical protein
MIVAYALFLCAAYVNSPAASCNAAGGTPFATAADCDRFVKVASPHLPGASPITRRQFGIIEMHYECRPTECRNPCSTQKGPATE